MTAPGSPTSSSEATNEATKEAQLTPARIVEELDR
jgi:hypothetical protein